MSQTAITVAPQETGQSNLTDQSVRVRHVIATHHHKARTSVVTNPGRLPFRLPGRVQRATGRYSSGEIPGSLPASAGAMGGYRLRAVVHRVRIQGRRSVLTPSDVDLVHRHACRAEPRPPHNVKVPEALAPVEMAHPTVQRANP